MHPYLCTPPIHTLLYPRPSISTPLYPHPCIHTLYLHATLSTPLYLHPSLRTPLLRTPLFTPLYSRTAGEKKPLDVTDGSKPGLRWLLAWFFLDGILFASTGKLSVTGLDDNPRVAALLAELKAAVERGVADRQLQTSPHLVLLSKPFYERELKPLLARWLLFFLRQHQLRSLSDAEAVAYLLTREPPPGCALNRVAAEPMKLLNLGADWLSAIAPHVLGRTSRVNFGLLLPNQITAGTPRNRRW